MTLAKTMHSPDSIEECPDMSRHSSKELVQQEHGRAMSGHARSPLVGEGLPGICRALIGTLFQELCHMRDKAD